MESKKVTLSILISIIIVGLIAIPFGNPKFFDRALGLELSFIIGLKRVNKHIVFK
jgi:hypothetical protein